MAYLLGGDFGVNLGGLYVRVACHMVGQTHLETALSAYLFEYFVTTAVARNGENMTVPSQSLVFLYDTLGNVHLATELFNLAVHRDTAHQRQVAVRLLAAFLHVK